MAATYGLTVVKSMKRVYHKQRSVTSVRIKSKQGKPHGSRYVDAAVISATTARGGDK